MKKKLIKRKSAAVLTVFDAPQFTKKGRRDIAGWLQRQAQFILTNSGKLSTRFTARYMYE